MLKAIDGAAQKGHLEILRESSQWNACMYSIVVKLPKRKRGALAPPFPTFIESLETPVPATSRLGLSLVFNLLPVSVFFQQDDLGCNEVVVDPALIFLALHFESNLNEVVNFHL